MTSPSESSRVAGVSGKWRATSSRRGGPGRPPVKGRRQGTFQAVEDFLGRLRQGRRLRRQQLDQEGNGRARRRRRLRFEEVGEVAQFLPAQGQFLGEFPVMPAQGTK